MQSEEDFRKEFILRCQMRSQEQVSSRLEAGKLKTT
jgi:hypothetical protein